VFVKFIIRYSPWWIKYNFSHKYVFGPYNVNLQMTESRQHLVQHLSKYIKLNDQQVQHLLNHLQQKNLPKKSFLLHESEIAHSAAFVHSGCLRSYHIDDNGFEHIMQFAPEGWWITDMYSFISQRPAHLFIDAIFDSEILMIRRTDQLKLFDEIPAFERFFRILTENSLVAFRQRIIDNLSLTAAEKYQQFCSRYPSLIDTIAKKQIASYIGVTPEFLSKITAKKK
jgi:CRP/FNR family transcriptional regulator, anaerobic regulatory protein